MSDTARLNDSRLRSIIASLTNNTYLTAEDLLQEARIMLWQMQATDPDLNPKKCPQIIEGLRELIRSSESPSVPEHTGFASPELAAAQDPQTWAEALQRHDLDSALDEALRSGLTLTEVASRLGIPVHQLAHLINP